MIFICLLILTLIIAAATRVSVFETLQPLAYFFHSGCLNRVLMTATSAPELKALVCGENFSTGSASQLLIACGLIHIFVVSGAHLKMLEKILIHLPFVSKIPQALLISILFIYTLACDLNPPITRSFLALIFALALKQRHLHWPENYRIFLIGLITLLIHPPWLISMSLQLSWIAALVVSINGLYFSKAGFFFKQSLFFIILWPLLLFLQIPSPTVILINLIFTPFLEVILFPLGLIVWFLPPLQTVFDFVIAELRFILNLFELQIASQPQLENLSVIAFGWTFIFFLHFLLHFTEMKLRKETYV